MMLSDAAKLLLVIETTITLVWPIVTTVYFYHLAKKIYELEARLEAQHGKT